MHRIFLLAALTALPALANAGVTKTEGAVARTLSVEQAQMQSVTPTVQSIAVNAVLDRPTGSYTVGEAVGLSVSVSQPAHLTVFNVGPDGRTTVLFPNRFNRDSLVAAERTISIPGPGARLVAQAPAGVELVKVIASAAPIDIAKLAEFREVGDFMTSGPGSADVVSRSLGVVAKHAVTAPAGAWGEAVITLVTTPAKAAPSPASVTHPALAAAAPITVQPISTDFALKISSEKAVYRIGEAISLIASATERCELTVLTFGPSGASGAVVPANPAQPQILEPGRPVKIAGTIGSGALTAAAPTGVETVRAFCSAEDTDVNGGVSGGATVAAAGQVAQRDVTIMPAITPGKPPARIAEAVAHFTVVE